MQPSAEQMQEALEVLRSGGVVVFPTETSYGLAADATQHAAVERIMRIKQRADEMPVALIVADQEMVEWCGMLSPELRTLTSRHWPGPLTVVIPEANPALSPYCLREGTVGVRISSHPVAHALTAGLGKPIVATSANVHGQPAAYRVENARAQFAESADQPDVYLDAGVLEPQPPSMIIEMVRGEIVVHRKGAFKL